MQSGVLIGPRDYGHSFVCSWVPNFYEPLIGKRFTVLSEAHGDDHWNVRFDNGVETCILGVWATYDSRVPGEGPKAEPKNPLPCEICPGLRAEVGKWHKKCNELEKQLRPKNTKMGKRISELELIIKQMPGYINCPRCDRSVADYSIINGQKVCASCSYCRVCGCLATEYIRNDGIRCLHCAKSREVITQASDLLDTRNELISKLESKMQEVTVLEARLNKAERLIEIFTENRGEWRRERRRLHTLAFLVTAISGLTALASLALGYWPKA